MTQAMTKTRDEIEAKGTLLERPIIPKWFKEECDGCTIPGYLLPRVMLHKRVVDACYIHDYRYTVIPMMVPIHSEAAKLLRKEADAELKRNCYTILSAYRTSRVRGFFFSPMYYWGVRIGGKGGKVPTEKKIHRWPTNPDELSEFIKMTEDTYESKYLRSWWHKSVERIDGYVERYAKFSR